MKRLQLFLVRTVHMRYSGFLFFPYDLQVKIYSKLKIVLPKWHPNSSAPQNNVAHGRFVRGKQRVKAIQYYLTYINSRGTGSSCIHPAISGNSAINSNYRGNVAS